ncbi:MAG: Ig-like domain-containing protein [Terracidiphilus sp.]
MRGIVRRGLRLELVAGLGIALAVPALAAPAGEATTTAMTAPLTTQITQSDAQTCSLTSFSVSVTSAAGVPAGTVSIEDGAVSLATADLNSTGHANFQFALADGAHSLSAVYAGNADFLTSSSAATSVTISNQCDSAFVVTVSNLTPTSTANTLTLTPGEAGTGTIMVTPSQEFVSTLTTPAFVNISCSGLPDQASCIYTPESIEILPEQNAAVTSSMVLQTYAASNTSASPATRPGKGSSPIAWAFLLPGALGLGGLAWGTRRRYWLSRLSLVALVSLVTLLGTTGCNPRYYYEHHSPIPNPPTPAGTYTVTVTAQSNNGVIAITQNTTFVLTVN